MHNEQEIQARLPRMTPLEKETFQFTSEVNPQSLYSQGLDEFAVTLFIPNGENIDRALEKITNLKRKCGNSPRNRGVKKYLESIETVLLFNEPGIIAGQIVDVISSHLIKEGFIEERLTKLVGLLSESLEAWSNYLEGKQFNVPVKILAQYQVLGALEIIELLLAQSKSGELTQKVTSLKEKVTAFAQKYGVPGFTFGEFSEVAAIMKENGADLGREKFYERALKYGFDYKESPEELEKNALAWIKQDLPKLRVATEKLAQRLNCKNDPESVKVELKKRPGASGKEVLATTIRIRPIIQELVGESIVGMNPKYRAEVIETPPYLSPIIPTGAATGFNGLTQNPRQIFYITTDSKRAPPSGFADLVQLLVHEEYGHCLHFSNTSTNFAAKPGITELLSSLHVGTTSEGLAFQRELEFLDLVEEIARKQESKHTHAEKAFVELTKDYGGIKQFLSELEFATYEGRITRFLRVVGDARINSGKQNLLDFLAWAEKETGLSQRTVFYNIFPAHEGTFPGYATCYAVVGQNIKAIQGRLKGDRKKLVKFNAYACSMGYPPRSIYIDRLRKYAGKLTARKTKRKPKTSRRKTGSRKKKL